MRRKRRNHSPAFKSKVALTALKGEKTLAQIAEQFDVHPNQVQQWKQQLLEGAENVFGSSVEKQRDTTAEIKKLHAKIGQLTVENDFLSEKLEPWLGENGK